MSRTIRLMVAGIFSGLLAGCAGLPTEESDSSHGDAHPASLPDGLPADAATYNPAEQRVLMRRDLYRNKDGLLSPLSKVESPTLPEPATVSSRSEPSKDHAQPASHTSLPPVEISVGDVQKISHD